MSENERGPSLLSRLAAVVVLAVVGWILLKLVIHVAIAIATVVAGIFLVIAVFWAIRTLTRD
jgi:hypothetical protein